ncbi:hypothetical protein ACM14_02580 [Delftia sp. JD2]|nr:hypothetical protein ACM14_02580 [Delftia sp. JD2]
MHAKGIMIHAQDKASSGWVSRIIHRYEGLYPEGQADRTAVAAGLEKSGGWWLAGELLVLADTLGDPKISSIIHTMLNPPSRHSRVTQKQRHAVADALLTRYETAWHVYATAMGKTVDELKSARDD